VKKFSAFALIAAFAIPLSAGVPARATHAASPAAAGAQAGTSQSIAARVEELMHQAKLDRKEALKVAAKERGLTRRAAYGQLISALDEPDRE